MKRSLLLLPMLLLAASCGVDPSSSSPVPDEEPDNCAPMFRQDVVPEYHVTISQDEWNKLTDEFLHVVERTDQGLDPTPYHPISLHFIEGDTQVDVAGAVIRLKGNSSWIQAIQLDENPKMQFVISFNETNPDARFEHLRKVDLDMPRSDQTFMHQRMAMWFMRKNGGPAQCANNARLYFNDQYYGLYTNLEHPDKEWLQRLFGHDADGDLWKGGKLLKTNEDTATMDHIDAFWAAQTPDQMAALVDMDAAYTEWTAEAMIGDADGYNEGRPNYFLYDDPNRGFVWMPDDLDTSIDWDFLKPDATPVFHTVPAYEARKDADWQHYRIVMNDPSGVARYVDALRSARAHFDVAAMQERIEAWGEQIEASVDEDAMKPFTTADHDLAVTRMDSYVPARAEFIDSWLGCWGGGGADADADGSDMCHDCDEAEPLVHPGGSESCDMLDNNCDGLVDKTDGVTVCQ